MNLFNFTDVNLGLFVLRLAVASVFLYHGLPKLMKARMMSKMVGMPAGMLFMLGMVETLSSIGLILGIYVQLSAILLSVVMIGAIKMKMTKWAVPFSATDKTGWEFDLILLAANAAIFFTGGGDLFRLL